MIKLDENEKLIKVFRKHWFLFALNLFILLMMAVGPLVIFFILINNLFFNLSFKNIYLLCFLYILFLVFVWILGAIMWIDYYLDMWILTNKKLIDVEQKGLFSREISSLRLDKIQDIKVETSGLLQTLLKIGDVHVQTAASQKEFVIRQANNPDLVKHLIMESHNLEIEKAQLVKIES